MSKSDLHKALLALLDILERDITRTETMADDLTRAAVALTNRRKVEAVRNLAIGERVKAIELQAQRAALIERYVGLFQSEL